MKKALSLLLIFCIVFCMTGCVSQDEFDAAIAERDAIKADLDSLKAELNTLQAQYDSLNSAVAPYTGLLEAMDAENYEAAMGIVSEKQIAKQLAEKGDIEEYLVTVELTVDNFGEYFEWKNLYSINTFGEEEPWNLQCALLSKAYEQGLILYKADVKLNYTLAFTFVTENGYTVDDSFESTQEWTDSYLPSTGCSAPQGSQYLLDECGVTMNRIEGTITFVKADYVTDYELGEVNNGYYQPGTVTLVNGETLHRSVKFGYKY